MSRILIADDEDGLRDFLAEVLEDEGHCVIQVSDGRQAIQQLEKSSFDLVMTDLRMPEVGGMEVLKSAKRLQPDAEVIVLTAHGSVDSAVEAMKLGAFDYLGKPLSSPGELRLLTKRALERRQLRAGAELERRSQPRALPLTYGAPSMKPVVHAIEKVARTNATVLLGGESGTGKEVAARALHRLSARSAGPFVAINCAALSETLLESELFGHEKGAFTGATSMQRGRIELASGGTFFLDEIGELKVASQAKLLRVLQEKQLERVGGRRSISVDVRWIAATNRDLEEMVEEGGFRDDLYHRLAVFPIILPPLRERREDILPLARFLVRKITADLGRSALTISDAAAAKLRAAHWRGNVRELANVLERAAILLDGQQLEADDLLLAGRAKTEEAGHTSPMKGTLNELEKAAIKAALDDHRGHRRRAAEQLGIPVRTLYDKLKRHDLG